MINQIISDYHFIVRIISSVLLEIASEANFRPQIHFFIHSDQLVLKKIPDI